MITIVQKSVGNTLTLIKKIRALKVQYPNQKIIAGMWFTDSSLAKNKRYYQESIATNTDDLLVLHLWYGQEIFSQFFNRIDIWEELLSHLKQNKSERSKDILSVPDFDDSDEIRLALKKLKENEPKLIKKLLSDNEDFVELRKELFPTGKNLRGLQ